jgi:hypothetical protein
VPSSPQSVTDQEGSSGTGHRRADEVGHHTLYKKTGGRGTKDVRSSLEVCKMYKYDDNFTSYTAKPFSKSGRIRITLRKEEAVG